MDGERPGIVVVGGGIAGLAAAYRLTGLLPGTPITLVERDDRLGGKILTERVDGFTVEAGPDSFLSAKPRGVGLCEELGLLDRLQGTTPRRHRAFVLRAERLHDLPEGLTGLVPTRLGPMLRTGLVSPLGKARMALDYVLPPRRGEDDESLAAFVRRRLGREVYERLIEPLMAGIYAADGERLSLAATFPQLREAELDRGGLIRGVLAAKKAATSSSTTAWPPFVAPAGGMAELVDALAKRLQAAGVRIVTGGTVSGLRVEPSPAGPTYHLTVTSGEALTAGGVVLAVPSFAAADILCGLDPALAADLRAIPHASSATVSLAYARADVPHPLDGHGYVVPRAEGRPVLACTWTSSKWAHRAPAGTALLRVFVGRAGQDEVLAGSDDELVVLARAELRAILGVTATPTLSRAHRWPRGLPQYTLGHLDRVAAIEARLAAHPGLALAGHSYRGVGIPDCIRSGEAAAERVRSQAAGGRNGS